VALTIHDLEASLVDLVFDERRHQQRLGVHGLARCFRLGHCRSGLREVQIGHEHRAAAVVLVRDIDAFLHVHAIARAELAVEHRLDFGNEPMMHIRPQARGLQIRVHSGERARHRWRA
jgi:hypothetical protein